MARDARMLQKPTDAELRDLLQSQLQEILKDGRLQTDTENVYREMGALAADKKKLGMAVAGNKTFLSLGEQYRSATDPAQKEMIQRQAKALVIVAGRVWTSPELEKQLARRVGAQNTEEYKERIIRDILATYEAPQKEEFAEVRPPTLLLPTVPPRPSVKEEKPKPPKEELEAPKVAKATKRKEEAPLAPEEMSSMHFFAQFLKPELRLEALKEAGAAPSAREKRAKAAAALGEKEVSGAAEAKRLEKPAVPAAEVEGAKVVVVEKGKKARLEAALGEEKAEAADFVMAFFQRPEVEKKPVKPPEEIAVEAKRKERRKGRGLGEERAGEVSALELLEAEEMEKRELEEAGAPQIGRRKKKKEKEE